MRIVRNIVGVTPDSSGFDTLGGVGVLQVYPTLALPLAGEGTERRHDGDGDKN